MNLPVDPKHLSSDPRLAVLARTMDIGVLLIAGDGSVEFANDRTLTLLDCRSEDELATAWSRLRREIETQVGRGYLQIPDTEPIDIDIGEGTTANCLRAEIHQLDEDPCIGCLILLRDSRAIEQVHANLRHALRFRSLARLQATAAHDMKGPLNVLALHIEILRQRLRSGDLDATSGGESLAVMKDEILRLDRMIQHVLSRGRGAESAASRFDVNRLVRDMVHTITPLCREHQVALHLNVNPEPITLSGDPERLRQALMNIVLNAVDAIGHRGTVTISVGGDALCAHIAIADTGPGIADTDLPRIWDPYFTTKPDGSGIGLFAARAVAQEFGGTIEACNGTGGGCVFDVRLPVAPADPSA